MKTATVTIEDSGSWRYNEQLSSAAIRWTLTVRLTDWSLGWIFTSLMRH
jgi:hypothetical protein